MINIAKLEKEMENILSPFRFQHSLGVMKKAGELATLYQVDVEIAKLTGLAHDIAKEMSDQELLLFAQRHHLNINQIELANRTSQKQQNLSQKMIANNFKLSEYQKLVEALGCTLEINIVLPNGEKI